MKLDWNFSNGIYKEFDDHINKSIPGISRIHDYIIRFSEWFAMDGSVVYDIGSSTGSLLKSIKMHNSNRNLSLRGIEVVEEMRMSGNYVDGIQFINEDASAIKLDKSNFIVSCFSMQFIPRNRRSDLYSTIYESLEEGGCFMLAEKTTNSNSIISEIKKSILLEDKLLNGIKEKDILEKDRKLRGVMNLDSEAHITKVLSNLGFKEIDVIFKDGEFTLFCALK